MIWARKGRKCWIVLEQWGKYIAVPGTIGGKAEGCLGWGICRKQSCREVVIEHEGSRSIEFVCHGRSLYRTRAEAQRAAKRMEREWTRNCT